MNNVNSDLDSELRPSVDICLHVMTAIRASEKERQGDAAMEKKPQTHLGFFPQVNDILDASSNIANLYHYAISSVELKGY
ncbi:unnamed protein product [Parnassius apollo]|uniref:(apollo) hypothetical protein n=1 Tax=Parnassius apollo TaxID=110799 RepID=A0A8S3Y578_PARAO|nr:unnamed protein product [Parnassius apollo]